MTRTWMCAVCVCASLSVLVGCGSSDDGATAPAEDEATAVEPGPESAQHDDEHMGDEHTGDDEQGEAAGEHEAGNSHHTGEH